MDERQIAVIDIACKFPGAPSVEVLWDKLMQCKAGITYDGAPKCDFVSSKGLIEGVYLFDHLFPGMNEEEVRIAFPQLKPAGDIAGSAGGCGLSV